MLLIAMHRSVSVEREVIYTTHCRPVDLSEVKVLATRLEFDDALTRIRIYQEAWNGKYVNARLSLILLHVSEVEDVSPINRDYFGIELVESLGQHPDEIGF